MIAPLLALLLCFSASPPASQPVRGHDPWVFRCALDGQPRMVVVALHPGVWFAFDAQRCSIHKIWRGDVQFTGTVYDTKHGPQPTADGEVLAAGAPAEIQFENAAPQQLAARWRGYRLVDGEVVLNFDLLPGITAQPISVSMTPIKIVDEAGNLTGMKLVIHADGIPPGAHLMLPLSDLRLSVPNAATMHDGKAAIRIDGDGKTTHTLEANQ